MTAGDVGIGVAIGLVSGVLAGVFGVGGGVVMIPGIHILLGAPPIVALATPLPAIFPTALVGALTSRTEGEVDTRGAAWLVGPGLLGAPLGAWLTEWIETPLLLFIVASLLGYQALAIVRDEHDARREPPGVASPLALGAIGATAGFVSGLLGIGGGLVMVPLLTVWLGMPLKRAQGTSLLAIAALVVPGSVVHAALGHIDVRVFLALTAGAVPGARLGAGIALGARESTLRRVVAGGLFLIAVGYALGQLLSLLGD